MLFKILHGDQSRISLDITPFHEGWCYVTHDGCFYVDLNIGTENDPNNQRLKLNAANAETLCGMTFDQIIEAANANAATLDAAVLSESKQYTDTAMEKATNQDVAVLHEAQVYTDAAIENVKIPDPVSIDLSALDTEGKIVETFADGSTKITLVEFDENGNPIKLVDADGNETVLTW
jgi:bacillopeptidase F (M6 metalloprotease family)